MDYLWYDFSTGEVTTASGRVIGTDTFAVAQRAFPGAVWRVENIKLTIDKTQEVR